MINCERGWVTEIDMHHMRIASIVAAVSLMALPTISQARPDAAASKPEQNSCFYLNQIQGQRAQDERSILFRVNVSDIYRLTFAHECSELNYPDPRLIITPFGGNGLICRALDIDVKVGQQGPHSFSVPCITDSIHKLTAAEITAIPKNKLP